MNFGHIKNIHFVGVGGIGMSGIAEILSGYDLVVSGCDLKRSLTTERLVRHGIRVAIGHDPVHVDSADLVVTSSAVKPSNAEVVHARELRVPVIRRAEMLGEIMRLKKGIAVAGTHGKTTTSAMTALVLAEAGLDPTLIVGGMLRNFEASARLGTGDSLVVEADEYDRSFLTLHPTLSVITNIEADHLDCYRDLDEIRSTFREFALRVPFYGIVIACADDPNVMDLVTDLPKRTLLYGTGEAATLRATDIEHSGGGTSFDVSLGGKSLGRMTLRVPGIHNVRNALAALGVGLELEVGFDVAAAALGKFTGVERRFQILGELDGAMVVDDYAHHPTEVSATLEAARKGYPGRRLIVVFQPHLFSRTRDFHEGFAEALGAADLAIVAPIYPAREDPIEGVSAAMIVDAAARRGIDRVQLVERDNAGLAAHIRSILRPRDLVITMGAGDVHEIGEALVGGGAR